MSFNGASMRTHGYRRVWLPTSIVMLLTSIVMWVPAIVVAESDAIDVAFAEGALAFSSSFIRRDLTPDGAVSRTADDKTILGKGDLLDLRMTELGNVAPDELYTIYRRAQKVFHPLITDTSAILSLRWELSVSRKLVMNMPLQKSSVPMVRSCLETA